MIENIEKFKSNIGSFVLFSVFFILLFLDLANGYLLQAGIIGEAGLASPSQLGRFLVIVLLIFYSFVYRASVFPFLIMMWLVVVESTSAFFYQDVYGFSYGLIVAYKIFYLMLLASVLSEAIEDSSTNYKFFKFLLVNLFLVSVVLYFSFLTGAGKSTYGYGFGTKAYFASGNGLGLYIGVISLFLLGLSYYNFFKIPKVVHFFIIFSIMLVGSKTAFLLFFVNIVCFFSLYKYRKSLFTISVVFAFYIIVNNLELIQSVFGVLFNRFQGAANIADFVGSGRNSFVINAFSVFLSQDSSIYRIFFGSGTFLSYQDPNVISSYDTLETDLFDILFSYGILGVVLYLGVIVKIAHSLRRYKFFLIGFLFLAFHSIFAGHVVFNGMSGVAFVVYFLIGRICNEHLERNSKNEEICKLYDFKN